MGIYEDILFSRPAIQLSMLDRAIYGGLHGVAQDPLLGSAMSEVPFLGTYMRAHEQADELNSLFRDANVSPTQVASPVSTYSSYMPSLAYGIGSVFGYRRGVRKKSRYRRYYYPQRRKMRYYYVRHY